MVLIKYCYSNSSDILIIILLCESKGLGIHIGLASLRAMAMKWEMMMSFFSTQKEVSEHLRNMKRLAKMEKNVKKKYMKPIPYHIKNFCTTSQSLCCTRWLDVKKRTVTAHSYSLLKAAVYFLSVLMGSSWPTIRFAIIVCMFETFSLPISS